VFCGLGWLPRQVTLHAVAIGKTSFATAAHSGTNGQRRKAETVDSTCQQISYAAAAAFAAVTFEMMRREVGRSVEVRGAKYVQNLTASSIRTTQ
jgi:hypothetical protein